MSRVISFFFAMLFFSLPAIAQVVIKGNAKEFQGKNVVVYSVADYVSSKNNVLLTRNIASDGSFKVDLDIADTRAVIIAIPPYQGLMYVEPGKNYEIVFPGNDKSEVRRFDKSEVALEFVNIPGDDLNVLIRQFNSDYFKFLNEHYYDFAVGEYRGSDVVKNRMAEKNQGVDLYKKAGADTSKVANVTSGFGNVITNFYNDTQLKYGEHYKNLFFADYVKYSLAEIELIAGRSKKSFYNEYFMSQPLLLQNPAYMKCLGLFYNNFLGTRPKDLQSGITKAISVERNGSQLVKMLENDSTALGNRIRTVAVIRSLKEFYFDKRYPRTAVEACLRELSQNAEDDDLKEMAKNTVSVLNNGREGWMPDDFVLADEQNNLWKWSENKGVYTYFIFFATWSSASVKEMLLLEKLNEQYKDYVRIVAINMDDDHELFQKYIREHKNQKFEFLFGNGDILLRDKLNIKSIPYALMVNPEGAAMFDYTRKPGEGIQSDFEKIKQLAASNPTQGPKTWKKKQ